MEHNSSGFGFVFLQNDIFISKKIFFFNLSSIIKTFPLLKPLIEDRFFLSVIINLGFIVFINPNILFLGKNYLKEPNMRRSSAHLKYSRTFYSFLSKNYYSIIRFTIIF